jgi:EmrB/QacA subfamily drug resistance transporter
MNRRTKALLTAGLMVGLLVSALDTTIVDTAFPRIVADLHGEAIFTWVMTIYMLTSTATLPVIGKLADTHGRKRFFLAGVLLFIGASVLCGLAQSMAQLILFRGLQGLGGGMLLPVAYTIVGDVYPGEQRATVQAFLSAVWGIASTAGPKLGGWLTQSFTWRWIFFINLPIGLIAVAIMLFAYREEAPAGGRAPIDWQGAASLTASITLFLLALARGGEAWAWTSWQSLGLFGLAACLLLLFMRAERQADEPVLDPGLFRNRMFLGVNAAGFAAGAAMYGAILFVPWFIQGVGGVDPNQAGNVATPMMLSLGMCTVLAGRLALRLPYRHLFSAGFALLAAGFWLMAGWNVQTTPLQATLSSMVVGAGLGLIIPMLTPTLQNAFPAERRGVVTSASQFFRQIGSTVGLTLFGVVFNQQMLRQAPGDPQAVVRTLLNRSLQVGLNPGVVEHIRAMMARALQSVFWAGLALVLLGLLGAQLLGGARLERSASAAQPELAPGD